MKFEKDAKKILISSVIIGFVFSVLLIPLVSADVAIPFFVGYGMMMTSFLIFIIFLEWISLKFLQKIFHYKIGFFKSIFAISISNIASTLIGVGILGIIEYFLMSKEIYLIELLSRSIFLYAIILLLLLIITIFVEWPVFYLLINKWNKIKISKRSCFILALLINLISYLLLFLFFLAEEFIGF